MECMFVVCILTPIYAENFEKMWKPFKKFPFNLSEKKTRAVIYIFDKTTVLRSLAKWVTIKFSMVFLHT
jgi:hypothetical protein